MPKLISVAKDAIILYTAAYAVAGLVDLSRDVAKTVADKIKK